MPNPYSSIKMSLLPHFPLYFFIMYNDMICDKRRQALHNLHTFFSSSLHLNIDVDAKDTIYSILNDSFIAHWSIHSFFFLFIISIHFHPVSLHEAISTSFLSFCLMTRKYNLCDILFLLNYKSIVWASQTHFSFRPHRLLLSTTSRIKIVSFFSGS